MGADGSFGGATDPGSAREEAERLVAAALAVARSAATGARGRAGTFGPLGQVISDVLEQVAQPPRGAEPAPTAAGSRPTDPWSAATTGPTPATSQPGAPGAPAPSAAGASPAEAPRVERPEAGAPLGAGFATGDPECCVCPVCRSIAALRDPGPELAERLATGAGDFAAGVASLLRAFSAVASATGSRSTHTGGRSTRTGADGGQADVHGTRAGAHGTRTGADGGRADVGGSEASSADPSGARSDAVWREATRTRHDSWPADEPDVWAAVTRAEPGARETGATAGPDRSTSAATDADRLAGPPAAGRTPVPASRAPQGPVTAGPGEQEAPEQGA